MKYGLIVARDVLTVILIIVGISGTITFLQKFHRDKESYAMNIMLTAFVSRITGAEVIRRFRERVFKTAYYVHSILYKKEFTDHADKKLQVIRYYRADSQDLITEMG